MVPKIPAAIICVIAYLVAANVIDAMAEHFRLEGRLQWTTWGARLCTGLLWYILTQSHVRRSKDGIDLKG